MSQTNANTTGDRRTGTASPRGTRYAIVALVAFALFALSYTFASARTGQPVASTTSSVGGPGTGSGAGGAACACCGSGSGSSTPIEGTAVVEGAVQRIDVDLSTGSYNPNTIILKADVPAEITFGQSGGCTAQVMSQDLDFFEDLTAGPKTVRLPALSAGEYQFSCGMQMVFGKIVVR